MKIWEAIDNTSSHCMYKNNNDNSYSTNGDASDIDCDYFFNNDNNTNTVQLFTNADDVRFDGKSDY